MAIINDLGGSYAGDAAADAGFIAKGWAKSNGVMYYDTVPGQFKRWDAALGVWTIDTGGYNSFPGIQRTLFVTKTTTSWYTQNGTPQFPYRTIQAALTAAAALGTPPSAANPVTILVYPGVYDESITAAAYVSLVGVGSAGSIVIAPTTTPAILLNIGAVERTFFSNLKLVQANNFAIVSAINGGADITEGPVFDNCQFIGNDNAAAKVHINGNFTRGAFHTCLFEHPNRYERILHYDTLFSVSVRGIWGHYDCTFYGMVYCLGNAKFTFQGGSIECVIPASGNTSLYCMTASDTSGSGFFVNGMRMRNNTASGVVFCFNCNSVYPKVITGCDLYCLSTAGFEMGSATGVQLDGTFIGNSMARGYDQYVRPVDERRKAVGPLAKYDFYSTFLAALYSMSASMVEVYITLYKDEAIPNTSFGASITMTIDGRGYHTLSGTGGAGAAFIGIWHTTTVRFKHITVGPGRILLGQNNARVQFLEGTKVVGNVVTTAGNTGQRIVLRHASIVSTSGPAIDLCADADYLRMVDSYIKGASGAAAILDSSPTNVSNCKWRGCTLISGSGAGNVALARSAAQPSVGVGVHSRYTDAPWVPAAGATWTNSVAAAQRMESYDVADDFDEDV